MSDDDAALLPLRGALTMYAVYDHPSDHPDYFVVRPWDIVRGEVTPRLAAGLFRQLEDARAWCQQFGLVRLERQEGDDPCIVEVWT